MDTLTQSMILLALELGTSRRSTFYLLDTCTIYLKNRHNSEGIVLKNGYFEFTKFDPSWQKFIVLPETLTNLANSARK